MQLDKLDPKWHNLTQHETTWHNLFTQLCTNFVLVKIWCNFEPKYYEKNDFWNVRSFWSTLQNKFALWNGIQHHQLSLQYWFSLNLDYYPKRSMIHIKVFKSVHIKILCIYFLPTIPYEQNNPFPCGGSDQR